jgi:hypothetical protein
MASRSIPKGYTRIHGALISTQPVVMRKKAYLVVFLEVGTGRFQGAGIYSEPAYQLTLMGGNSMPATVFECEEETFDLAAKAAVENCRMFCHLRWLLPHLKERGYV